MVIKEVSGQSQPMWTFICKSGHALEGYSQEIARIVYIIFNFQIYKKVSLALRKLCVENIMLPSFIYSLKRFSLSSSVLNAQGYWDQMGSRGKTLRSALSPIECASSLPSLSALFQCTQSTVYPQCRFSCLPPPAPLSLQPLEDHLAHLSILCTQPSTQVGWIHFFKKIYLLFKVLNMSPFSPH